MDDLGNILLSKLMVYPEFSDLINNMLFDRIEGRLFFHCNTRDLFLNKINQIRGIIKGVCIFIEIITHITIVGRQGLNVFVT